MAIDPGTRHLGIAVSDGSQIIATPLKTLERRSWKKLLSEIKDIVSEFDAKALVIGLPYGFDGGETEMSIEAREMARKFSLSLPIPVFLQDERATSYEARRRIWERNVKPEETKALVDAEAAAIILTDFMSRLPRRSR